MLKKLSASEFRRAIAPVDKEVIEHHLSYLALLAAGRKNLLWKRGHQSSKTTCVSDGLCSRQLPTAFSKKLDRSSFLYKLLNLLLRLALGTDAKISTGDFPSFNETLCHRSFFRCWMTRHQRLETVGKRSHGGSTNCIYKIFSICLAFSDCGKLRSIQKRCQSLHILLTYSKEEKVEAKF